MSGRLANFSRMQPEQLNPWNIVYFIFMKMISAAGAKKAELQLGSSSVVRGNALNEALWGKTWACGELRSGLVANLLGIETVKMENPLTSTGRRKLLLLCNRCTIQNTTQQKRKILCKDPRSSHSKRNASALTTFGANTLMQPARVTFLVYSLPSELAMERPDDLLFICACKWCILTPNPKTFPCIK